MRKKERRRIAAMWTQVVVWSGMLKDDVDEINHRDTSQGEGEGEGGKAPQPR